jgi:hypothetical protein
MFGRRKRAAQDGPGEAAATADGTDVDETGFVDDLDEADRAYEDELLLAELEAREAAPAVLTRPQGPWDAADAPTDELPRLDLGGLLVPVPPDMQVRVDVTEEGAVYAATLLHGESSVQVNAFAAPRTEGIWAEVLQEIADSLAGGGGRVDRLEGAYGPELRADLPTQQPGGGIVLAPARFVGVDGPRWFLRALFTGPAAVDPAAAEPLEAAVRAVVVVRGSDPMAVRDALPLRLPPDVQAVPEPDEDDDEDPLTLAERGPEITEIR